MDHYKIVMTPDSVEDLRELRDYIAYVLCAPETALEYIQSIRKMISTLEMMPSRVIPVSDEPWHSIGIRKIASKNFYIYFRIDENEKTFYILNTIYNKRDQLRILEDMDIEGDG